jgi:polysaccharide pyruvyl transferase WcaK-like protein
MKKAVLIGYYGNANFGDDLILDSFVTRIVKKYSKVTVLNSGSKPYLFSFNNVKNKVLPKIKARYISKLNFFIMLFVYLKEVLVNDDIYFAGGTQLFETKKNRYYNLVVYAITIKLAALLGKNIVHIGVGVNKPLSMQGRYLLKSIIKNSNCLFVRDQLSLDTCNELTDNVISNVKLSADLAYLRGNILFNRKKESVIKIGVNFFPYFSEVEGDKMCDVDIFNQVAKLINKYKASSLIEVYLLGSQKDHKLCDINHMKKFDLEREGLSVHVVEYEHDVLEYMKLFSELDVIISMRLHLIITAKLYSVPDIIGLAYQHKVVSECESLGVPYFNYLMKSPSLVTPALIDNIITSKCNTITSQVNNLVSESK